MTNTLFAIILFIILGLIVTTFIVILTAGKYRVFVEYPPSEWFKKMFQKSRV